MNFPRLFSRGYKKGNYDDQLERKGLCSFFIEKQPIIHIAQVLHKDKKTIRAYLKTCAGFDVEKQLRKGGRFHNGFLAQQVKAAADEMGFNFTGFKDLSVNDGEDLYSLTYEEFIAPMVAAIQALTKQNEDMARRIELLEQARVSSKE